jgi:putative solute:sodium symporter small subunit
MVRRQSDAEGESQPRAQHDALPSAMVPDRARIHWERTRRLTGILLAIWFFVTFSVIFFARELSHLSLFGWPISYYMAAQGATLVYVIVVGFYAWRMRVLDGALIRENAGIRLKDHNNAS